MTVSQGNSNEPTKSEDKADPWSKLRIPHFTHNHGPVKNANSEYQNSLSPLDKLAVAITDKVGSMGFFFLILAWTVIWCGYNILASDVSVLHWKSFDPFPAFVAYLLISNVIQIFLMPLIMVGQNVQGRHSEIRAELDYEINQKAENEVMAILSHLERNTDLLIQLMKHLECRISEQELKEIVQDKQIAEELKAKKIAADAVAG
jgi:uncharacterized membrane protein